jgi:hypothetical protein
VPWNNPFGIVEQIALDATRSTLFAENPAGETDVLQLPDCTL